MRASPRAAARRSPRRPLATKPPRPSAADSSASAPADDAYDGYWYPNLPVGDIDAHRAALAQHARVPYLYGGDAMSAESARIVAEFDRAAASAAASSAAVPVVAPCELAAASVDASCESPAPAVASCAPASAAAVPVVAPIDLDAAPAAAFAVAAPVVASSNSPPLSPLEERTWHTDAMEFIWARDRTLNETISGLRDELAVSERGRDAAVTLVAAYRVLREVWASPPGSAALMSLGESSDAPGDLVPISYLRLMQQCLLATTDLRDRAIAARDHAVVSLQARDRRVDDLRDALVMFPARAVLPDEATWYANRRAEDGVRVARLAAVLASCDVVRAELSALRPTALTGRRRRVRALVLAARVRRAAQGLVDLPALPSYDSALGVDIELRTDLARLRRLMRMQARALQRHYTVNYRRLLTRSTGPLLVAHARRHAVLSWASGRPRASSSGAS